MEWDTLDKSGEVISSNMRQMSMQGHAGQFSMDKNGDKLASYSILALNHSGRAFNTAWTLRTKFLGNCTEQDLHCSLETNTTFSPGPGLPIIWPGTCEDKIYKAVAVKRFGEFFCQNLDNLSTQVFVTLIACFKHHWTSQSVGSVETFVQKQLQKLLHPPSASSL